jgi:hypothetical protein
MCVWSEFIAVFISLSIKSAPPMQTIARSLFTAGILLVSSAANAATLLNMTFNNGLNDISETAGWDGTTAPGGSLVTGLNVSSGMRIYGDFQGKNDKDIFHVDGWQTTNSPTTRVGLSVSTVLGYTLNLGDGLGQFETRLHQHPPGDTDMFNSVELRINGISVASQSYTPGGAAQTLTWNIGSNSLLNGLTAATFDLYFSGTNNTAQNNHGPEWSLADGAFLKLTGTIVPEPSRALLLLGGLVFAGARRRRVTLGV